MRDWACVVSLVGREDFDFEVLALMERRRGEGAWARRSDGVVSGLLALWLRTGEDMLRIVAEGRAGIAMHSWESLAVYMSERCECMRLNGLK